MTDPIPSGMRRPPVIKAPPVAVAPPQDSMEDLGKKGPQFLTMTRADFAAYEYLLRQKEAKEWIELCTKEKMPDEDFWKCCADGIALCKLVNAIWPGTLPRWNGPQSYRFKLLENISLFLNAVKDKGVPEKELFQPIDLFEKKNLPRVLGCLKFLAGMIQKQGFTIPWPPKRTNVEFSPKEIQEAKKLDGVSLWTPTKGPGSGGEDSPNRKSVISEAEEASRLEALNKKREAEKQAEEELVRKQAEQEALLKKQQQEEEERKRKEEEEARRKKMEEEARRKLEEELERARVQKQKELENELMRQKEEEQRKRKEKEEHEENQKAIKFGGKENLNKIRNMMSELESLLVQEDGNSILHLAAERDLADVTRYLVEENKVNPNAVNANNDTPLHIAARKNDEKLVDVLIKAGANVNVMNRDGDCPTHVAATHGSEKVMSRLINAGAEINGRNFNLDTPLILAAKNGHGTVIEVLVKKSIDVNASNKQETTALHYSAERGSVPFVNHLYTTGKLDLNPRNKDNATPLQIAAENNHFEVVKRLVELGADLNTKRNDGWSPLYTAAYNGDSKMVVFLLSKGADVDGVNEEGWTPLHAACAQGHTKLVKALVDDFNASINVLNEQGTTPIFHAVSAGRRSITEYLVEKGADVDLSKEGGWKPIHAATYNEFEKLTNFLVDKGADLSSPCKDIQGYTPLHILISTEEPPSKLIDLLVRNGAPLNSLNVTGSTPLHLAAFWGHYSVVTLLVEEGAKMDLKNDKGRTALDVAALYGHKKIAEYLSQKSNKPMPTIKTKERKTLTMYAPAEPPTPDKIK